MNHEERRELKKRSCEKLKSSRAFFVMTLDGKGMPIYAFDLSNCKEEEDLRNIAMAAAVASAIQSLDRATEALRERIKEIEDKGEPTEELVVEATA